MGQGLGHALLLDQRDCVAPSDDADGLVVGGLVDDVLDKAAAALGERRQFEHSLRAVAHDGVGPLDGLPVQLAGHRPTI